MRWRDLRRSQNVRDVRGRSFGGGGMKLGIGGLVIAALAYFAGVDPRLVMGLLDGGGATGPDPTQLETAPPSDDAGDFAAAILGSTEDVWSQLFSAAGSSLSNITITRSSMASSRNVGSTSRLPAKAS